MEPDRYRALAPVLHCPSQRVSVLYRRCRALATKCSRDRGGAIDELRAGTAAARVPPPVFSGLLYTPAPAELQCAPSHSPPWVPSSRRRLRPSASRGSMTQRFVAPTHMRPRLAPLCVADRERSRFVLGAVRPRRVGSVRVRQHSDAHRPKPERDRGTCSLRPAANRAAAGPVLLVFA
jgi:hypothetical protein